MQIMVQRKIRGHKTRARNWLGELLFISMFFLLYRNTSWEQIKQHQKGAVFINVNLELMNG